MAGVMGSPLIWALLTGAGLCLWPFALRDNSATLRRAIDRRARAAARRSFSEDVAQWAMPRVQARVAGKVQALGLNAQQVGSLAMTGGAVGLVGGLFVSLVANLPIGIVPLAAFGAFLGAVAIPPWTINGRFRSWQRQVIAETPDLVLWLEVFFSLGYGPQAALSAASRRLRPGKPLQAEVRRVLGRIAADNDYNRAINDSQARMGHQDLTLFWEGIRTGWESVTPVESLRGIALTIERLEDLAIAQRTGIAGMAMPALVGLLLFSTIGLVLIPYLQNATSLGSGLGLFG